MKIKLVGCGNRGYAHHKVFLPWVDNPKRQLGPYRHHSYRLGLPGDPMEWLDGNIAGGDIHDLKLNGNYLVTLEFEDAELKNWLNKYIETKPQEALELFAEMLPLAVEKLKATD